MDLKLSIDHSLPEDLVVFNYRNAKGEESNREVDVERVYTRHGDIYIDGYCRLREDNRVFLLARIEGKIFVPALHRQLTSDEFISWRGIDEDEDSWAGDSYGKPVCYWESVKRVPVKAHIKIGYQDSGGVKSDRAIQVNEYDGTSYLRAFCELRQELRTFRIERVVRCVDVETGEVVADLPQYLLKKYQQSPEYDLEQGLEKLADILAVLFYVGKADGQLRAEERHILRAVVRKVSKHKLITDDMIDRELNKQTVPSIQAIKLAINRICKINGHNMETTFKIAQLIVETQKKVHPSEAEIMEYMARKMKQEGIKA